MANTVKMKRSSVAGKVPATTDLELGELAVNTYDGKLFLKKLADGNESVVEVGLTSSHNHDASYPTLAAFNALGDEVATAVQRTSADRAQTGLDVIAAQQYVTQIENHYIQTGQDAAATAEDRQVVEAYVGDINNLVTIPFAQFATDLIRTQTIVVEHHGFT